MYNTTKPLTQQFRCSLCIHYVDYFLHLSYAHCSLYLDIVLVSCLLLEYGSHSPPELSTVMVTSPDVPQPIPWYTNDELNSLTVS